MGTQSMAGTKNEHFVVLTKQTYGGRFQKGGAVLQRHRVYRHHRRLLVHDQPHGMHAGARWGSEA